MTTLTSWLAIFLVLGYSTAVLPSPATPPLSVLLLPLADYSHVLFFVDIGNELDRKGHKVHLASTNQYETLLANYPFTFHDIGVADWAPLSYQNASDVISFFAWILLEKNVAQRKLMWSFVKTIPKDKFDIIIVDNDVLANFPDNWRNSNATLVVVNTYPSYREDPSYSHISRGTFQVTYMESLFDSTMHMVKALWTVLLLYGRDNQAVLFEALRSDLDQGQELHIMHTIPGFHHPIDFPQLQKYVIVGVPLSDKKLTHQGTKSVQIWLNQLRRNDVVVCMSFGSIGYHTKLEEIVKGVLVTSNATKIILSHRYPERLANTFKSEIRSKRLAVFNWIDQRKVLAHPKTKLLVTHGGIHSIVEALSQSLPLLMIPYFDSFQEQVLNCLLVQTRGVGEMIKSGNVNQKRVKEKTKKLLANWEKYSVKAKALYKTNLLAGGAKRAADEIERAWLQKRYNFKTEKAPDTPVLVRLLGIATAIFFPKIVLKICRKCRCKRKTD
ncbi:2-hydroxyacylsphingosine 1-beta-galactosyltransferase-like [Oscarella lobularis]|uniref:2-hydroxyacylsphingosine 1-beta-galactosyltransferase-like n=1 Tax=Oscarella lobularis TaxID=121494 RepID=UPI0033132564